MTVLYLPGAHTAPTAARTDTTQRAMDNAVATALAQIDEGGNRINAIETVFRAGITHALAARDELAARRQARHTHRDDAS